MRDEPPRDAAVGSIAMSDRFGLCGGAFSAGVRSSHQPHVFIRHSRSSRGVPSRSKTRGQQSRTARTRVKAVSRLRHALRAVRR